MAYETHPARNFFKFAENAHAFGQTDLAHAMIDEARRAESPQHARVQLDDPHAIARYAARVYDSWDNSNRTGSVRLTPPNYSVIIGAEASREQVHQIQTMFGVSPHSFVREPGAISSRRQDFVLETTEPGILFREQVNGEVVLFAEDPRTKTARPSEPDHKIPSFPGADRR